MELDNLALESVMDARRKAVQTSIRQISTEELNSLVTEILFEDPAHPWCEIFRQFIKDNASAGFYQASTTEHIQLVYCRARELGIWFIPGAGVGLLGTRELNAMKEIVDCPTKLPNWLRRRHETEFKARWCAGRLRKE